VDGHQIRRWEGVLRRLPVTIPNPFDPWAFRDAVARQRRRPIRILRLDTARDGVVGCGLWVRARVADYIVVDRDAPRELAGHLLCHELAHILLDHKGLMPFASAALGFDRLDPEMIQRVLGRSGRFSDSEERDAEGLATVVRSFAARRSPVPRPRDGDSADMVAIDRVSSVFCGDRGWLS